MNSINRTKKWITYLVGLLFLGAIVTFYLPRIYKPEASGNTPDWVIRENASWTAKTDTVEVIQTERRRQVNEKCAMYQNQVTARIVNVPLLERFLVDDDHGLLYCYIPKVASTNWKKILMILTNKTNVTDIKNISSDEAVKNNRMLTLDKYSKAGIRYRLKNYLKFTFVRHPFERLVSAYNNKLVEANTFYRMSVGRTIIERYRKEPSERSLRTGHDVLFPEFVQYVIDEWRTGQLMDVHWRPMVDLCTPCHVHYDVVGKFETLKEDADFVLNSVNQTRVRGFPRFHPAVSKSSAKLYVDQLTAQQLNAILFHVYKYDFELFDYSTNL